MMTTETQSAFFTGILEPKEFCEKYARLKEGVYGYKGNWVRLLAHCLGITPKAVERWGNPPDFPECPDRYKQELGRINALKVAEAILEEHGLTKSFLDSLE